MVLGIKKTPTKRYVQIALLIATFHLFSKIADFDRLENKEQTKQTRTENQSTAEINVCSGEW